jgi:hypothetical protein
MAYWLLSWPSSPSSLIDILSRLYLTHNGGTQKPAESTLVKSLKDILKLSEEGPTCIMIDVLDECPDISGMPTPRKKVLELVEELVRLQLPNLHICVTSRPEFDIRTTLGPLTSLRVSLHDKSGQKQDILDYITKVVHADRNDCGDRRWREQDKQLVIKVLSEKAGGM